jgi:hypothetical protein
MKLFSLFILFAPLFNSFQRPHIIKTQKTLLRVRLTQQEIKQIDIFKHPIQMLTYITSFREYTIITNNIDCRDLVDKMNSNKMDTYYMDLNNLLYKNDVLQFLKKKYNNVCDGEDLWIFHQGHYIGSSEDIKDIISRKENSSSIITSNISICSENRIL